MDVELIAIGDEIISGHTIDTNTAYIAAKLAEIGLEVTYKSSVGDDLPRMEEVFSQAMKRSDIIITTGGLGPTDDDITKRAIVKVFKRNLVFHEYVLEDIKKRFAARGIEMPSINQNQALLPQGATYLSNRIGSAVGIVIEENKRIFISLPGVPREARLITSEEILPYLQTKIKGGFLKVIKLRTTGIIESALADIIKPELKIPENVKLAYLPFYGGVDLRIIAHGETLENAEQLAESVAANLRKKAGKYIFGEGEETLEDVIGKLLRERNKKLATAESCTAGLLSGYITAVAGSSDYFDRGFVTYSNKAKMELLGVPEDIINDYGAVSAECSEAMARGALERAGVDYAVSITGIAGPSGGTQDKPVGTVFIAVASENGVRSRKFQLSTDREVNRNRSVYAALEMLRRVILEID